MNKETEKLNNWLNDYNDRKKKNEDLKFELFFNEILNFPDPLEKQNEYNMWESFEKLRKSYGVKI